MRQFINTIMAFVLVFACVFKGDACAKKREVLFLSSYEISEKWTESVLSGFKSSLTDTDMSLHLETLDARSRHGEGYSSKFAEYLEVKYSKISLDLVVLVDNAAFDLFMSIRSRIQEDVPIVFCGFNNVSDSVKNIHNLTGVNEDVDILGTIKLALNIFPKASLLAVVGGSQGIGALNLENFRKVASDIPSKVVVQELIDIKREDAAKIIANLPDGTIVLRMDNLREPDGSNSSLEQSISTLAENNRFPVFTFWDFDMGRGAIGGVVVSGWEQGREAGRLAAQILMGQSAAELPIVMRSPNIPMFSYGKLQLFNVSRDKLPPESVVLDEPKSYYSQNKLEILISSLIFVFMSTCIVILYTTLRSRKKVELDLRESENRNRQYVDNAPLGIFIADEEGRYTDVNPEACRITGYSKNELLEMRVENILASSSLELGREHFRSVLCGGRSVVELSALRKNGEIRWWSVVATRLSRDRLIAFVDDVTEKREQQNAQFVFLELLDNAEHVVVFKDVDLRYVMVNRAYTELTGKTLQDVIGKTDLENFEGLSTPAQISAYVYNDKQALALEPKQCITVEEEALSVNGYRKIYMTKKFPVYSDDGVLLGTGTISWDVTEIKKSQEATLKSVEILKTVMDALPADIYVMDPNTYQVLFVNKIMQERFGGEIIGKQCWRVFRNESGPCTCCPLNQLLMGNGPDTITWEDRNPVTGSIFVNLDTLITWSDGRKVKLQVATDVTDLRTMEAALADTQSRLSLALEVTSDALWDWRLDTEKVYFSPRWYTMLGYEPYEFPSTYTTWKRLVHQDDLIKVEPVIKKHLDTGAPYEVEFRMRTKLGKYKWILARGKVVEWQENGEALRLLGTHMDITDRKRSAEELVSAKNAAETANRAKSEFLANMSHEIRTPLNGILGMLQLIQTTDPNDEQKEYLVGAIRSTNRLTRLLSDILDISRIEAGRMDIVETEFNIYQMRDSIRELFDMEARGKGLLLEFVWNDQLPPVLIGDEVRLRQILFNLVGNAIKFAEKGEIRVSASLLPNSSYSSVRVLVTVSDTGIGISDECIKSVFEPFVQEERTYTRRFQGAGLGLSIVRRLVKLLGGDISIDSTVGEGTTVYLSLPFKLPSGGQGQIDQEVRVIAPTAEASWRILLAEDDSLSSLTCKRMLEKSGYSVTVAKDGQEALQRLTEEDFDLILMDVQMPVMDGVEATKVIRGASNLGAKSSIPIVAMTAYAMNGDKETFLAAGMDDYISKPVDKAALIEVIERVLSLKRNIQ